MTEPQKNVYQLNWDAASSSEITLGTAQLPAAAEYPMESDTELHGRQYSRKILPTRFRSRSRAYTKKSPTGQDYLHERKLREAANQADLDEVLTLVMQHGVNPCSADSKSRTPLHFAATQGNEHVVEVLLDRGANPNAKDMNGNTPLHLAACTNQVKIVTLLLRAGTDINAVDATGRTPLDVACSRLKMLQRSTSIRGTPSNYRREVLLIIDMLNEYLSRAGRTQEREQLNEISSKFNNVTTVEQVGMQVLPFITLLTHAPCPAPLPHAPLPHPSWLQEQM